MTIFNYNVFNIYQTLYSVCREISQEDKNWEQNIKELQKKVQITTRKLSERRCAKVLTTKAALQGEQKVSIPNRRRNATSHSLSLFQPTFLPVPSLSFS